MCSEVKNTCAYMHMYIYFTHIYSIRTLYNKDIHAIHVYMIIIYTLYIIYILCVSLFVDIYAYVRIHTRI